MADTVDYVAERLRKHLSSRKAAVITRLLKGVAHEEYLKLCGNYQELESLSLEVTETVKKINSSEDLDSDDTALMKSL